jgi:hypothetical protein
VTDLSALQKTVILSFPFAIQKSVILSGVWLGFEPNVVEDSLLLFGNYSTKPGTIRLGCAGPHLVIGLQAASHPFDIENAPGVVPMQPEKCHCDE